MKTLSYADHEQLRALLLGRKVTKVGDDLLHLDDGTTLKIVPNQGCSCGMGDYSLDELNGCDNVVTAVEFGEENLDDWKQDDVFQVFVYADNQRINLLSVSGMDNGCYGVGYEIQVTPC